MDRGVVQDSVEGETEMKKMTVELNDFCEYSCPYMEIDPKSIEGEDGDDFECKYVYLCRRVASRVCKYLGERMGKHEDENCSR